MTKDILITIEVPVCRNFNQRVERIVFSSFSRTRIENSQQIDLCTSYIRKNPIKYGKNCAKSCKETLNFWAKSKKKEKIGPKKPTSGKQLFFFERDYA